MPTFDLATDAAGNVLQVDLGGDSLLATPGAGSGGGGGGVIVAWVSGLPAPWAAGCRLLRFGGDLTPPLGGAMQRIERLGKRWSVDFTKVPALGAACARQLLIARNKARANGLAIQFSWPQPLFAAAAIGAPAVNGAGQLGSLLVVNGFTPGASIPAGTFFSLTVGARSYLHASTAAATADGSGNATLPIAPMLRAQPANGAALTFDAPVIEGFIQGRSEDWSLERLAWTGITAFTVTEVA